MVHISEMFIHVKYTLRNVMYLFLIVLIVIVKNIICTSTENDVFAHLQSVLIRVYIQPRVW